MNLIYAVNQTKGIIKLFVFLILMQGCMRQERQSSDEIDSTISDKQAKTQTGTKTYRYSNHMYRDEEFERTDILIQTMVPGYTYVQNIWGDSVFMCFEEQEHIQQMLKIDSNRIFIVTSLDKQKYIYDIDLFGDIRFRKMLDPSETPYYYRFNSIEGKIYFKSHDRNYKIKRTWEYNPDSLAVFEVVEGKENIDAKLQTLDPDKVSSPTGEHTVEIDYEELWLYHNYSGSMDTLIDLHADEYFTDWCFSNVCWNEDGDKFYFDNSGELACIWEVDMVKKTIDKIVPEHFAESPIWLGDAVFYLYQNCIHRTWFQSFGTERNVYLTTFDTVKSGDLETQEFHFSEIKNFPDSLLWSNTKEAKLAVHADRGIYKVRFLYALSDSVFIETSSMTFSYSNYKCPNPEPRFEKGQITYECEGGDGKIYGEKFKVENFNLIYSGSYHIENNE